MRKSMIKGTVIGDIAMVVFVVSILTGCEALNKPKFAEVVGVVEITETDYFKYLEKKARGLKAEMK